MKSTNHYSFIVNNTCRGITIALVPKIFENRAFPLRCAVQPASFHFLLNSTDSESTWVQVVSATFVAMSTGNE